MSWGKRAITGAVVLCAGVVLAGCAAGPKRVVAGDQLWKDQTSVIGVAVAKLPTGGAYRQGSQGLLDMAINNATSAGIDGFLASADYSAFNALADQLVTELQGRGLTVKRIAEPVDVAAFAKLQKDTGAASSRATPGRKQKAEPAQASSDPALKSGPNKAERDFRSLAAANGIDKLLIVTLTQVGTMRPYYGFIPMGPPAGYAAANGQVIDLKTLELQWNASTTAQQTVLGEWDTPPAYAAVGKASAQAVDTVKRSLVGDLMWTAPSKPATATATPAPAAAGGK